MEQSPNTAEPNRFGFGLPVAEVERLRVILSRLEGREVTLDEAWGRASELLALAHTMMEVLATTEAKAPSADGSKVVPGDLLTDSRN